MIFQYKHKIHNPMFTGIITDVGEVTAVNKDAADWLLVISTNYDTDKISIGSSIACNGVCLTVIKKSTQVLEFQVSHETIRCTNFKNINIGASINLEKSLCVGDELSGHIVLGHVDTTTYIKDIIKEGDSYRFSFEVPQSVTQYIVPKGSITLNGVALTVNQVSNDEFSINIIPHTWKNTVFHQNKSGDLVNLEIDTIARYIGRLYSQNR